MALARDRRVRKGQEWGLIEGSLTLKTYIASDSCPLPCSGESSIGCCPVPWLALVYLSLQHASNISRTSSDSQLAHLFAGLSTNRLQDKWRAAET